MAELLRQMAELLQPRLNDRRGPVPQVPRIMAAILVASDSLPAREACRTVRGWQDAMGGDEPRVPNDAHSSITRLAVRVRALIDRDAHEGAPNSSNRLQLSQRLQSCRWACHCREAQRRKGRQRRAKPSVCRRSLQFLTTSHRYRSRFLSSCSLRHSRLRSLTFRPCHRLLRQRG